MSRSNRNEIALPSGAIMQSEEGGKTFPCEVELERPIQLLPDQAYEIKVFMDGSICEIYLNDEVAMSARMYNIPRGKLGLFVSQGSAQFSDVKSRPEDKIPNETTKENPSL